ncbi:MAG TPA: 50S ribosomal protein L19 [Candidatus Paceibacterota bacterium]
MNTVISPVKSEERTKLGLRPGDTVRVHQKVVERGKTRIQVFEGLVIAVKHGNEAGGTFTVRATLSGVGVEKTFPLYTPLIEKIEIVKRSKVRRAKLYFIREKAAKAVRRQLRNARMMNISTDDFAQEEVPAAAEVAPTEEAPAEAAPVEESVSEPRSDEKKEEAAA